MAQHHSSCGHFLSSASCILTNRLLHYGLPLRATHCGPGSAMRHHQHLQKLQLLDMLCDTFWNDIHNIGLFLQAPAPFCKLSRLPASKLIAFDWYNKYSPFITKSLVLDMMSCCNGFLTIAASRAMSVVTLMPYVPDVHCENLKFPFLRGDAGRSVNRIDKDLQQRI